MLFGLCQPHFNFAGIMCPTYCNKYHFIHLFQNYELCHHGHPFLCIINLYVFDLKIEQRL